MLLYVYRLSRRTCAAGYPEGPVLQSMSLTTIFPWGFCRRDTSPREGCWVSVCGSGFPRGCTHIRHNRWKCWFDDYQHEPWQKHLHSKTWWCQKVCHFLDSSHVIAYSRHNVYMGRCCSSMIRAFVTGAECFEIKHSVCTGFFKIFLCLPSSKSISKWIWLELQRKKIEDRKMG